MADKDRDIPEIEPWKMEKLPNQPGDSSTDVDLKSIIRNSFREPILPEESIYAEIDSESYQVIDIGSQGIGLTVPSKNSLKTKTSYDLTLHIGENSLVFITKIAHISPCDDSGLCQCGVKIMDMTKDLELKLQQFLIEHHEKLFTEENK
jgi:hypothetical protein